MTRALEPSILRAMTAADVPAVLDVQEPGAVLGLADVFPQDTHPFRRDDVAQRWLQEIYEKLGWPPTGERTHSSFPPHPELLHYERDLR